MKKYLKGLVLIITLTVIAVIASIEAIIELFSLGFIKSRLSLLIEKLIERLY